MQPIQAASCRISHFRLVEVSCRGLQPARHAICARWGAAAENEEKLREVEQLVNMNTRHVCAPLGYVSLAIQPNDDPTACFQNEHRSLDFNLGIPSRDSLTCVRGLLQVLVGLKFDPSQTSLIHMRCPVVRSPRFHPLRGLEDRTCTAPPQNAYLSAILISGLRLYHGLTLWKSRQGQAVQSRRHHHQTSEPNSSKMVPRWVSPHQNNPPGDLI